MIDHLGISVSDYEKSKGFFLNVLEKLGHQLVIEVTPEMIRAGVVVYEELSGEVTPDFLGSQVVLSVLQAGQLEVCFPAV